MIYLYNRNNMGNSINNSKTLTSILLATFMFLSLASFGNSEQARDENVKTGWRLGGLLPIITFDSDLGLQYGALVNFFDYGDGTRFPRYNHSLYFEVSRFTGGSGVNRFFYDSDRLINGIRTTFDVTYMTDPLLDFFGFNGYQSVYNSAFIDPDSEDYISRAFYAFDRKKFRAKLDLQGKIGDGNFGWLSGFETYHVSAGSVDIERLNKGKAEDLLPDVPGLYDRYVEWGLISQDEQDGGWVNYLKGGLTYDTRDHEPNPMRGIWTEAVVFLAPGSLVTGDMGHARLSLAHRQYFTLIPEDLSLAYRINIQQNIGGQAPFYLQSLVITSFLRSFVSEGLGGRNTLRGILRHRVVGNGYALGNLELRWKFLYFNIGNTNVYLGLNGFLDAGMVIDNVAFHLDDVPENKRHLYFEDGNDTPHVSAGAGLRVAINRNFIVACDFGKAFDKRDGDTGLYIGLNYLF
ncbi:MAG: hypothetical protein EA394_00225 [Bacteroidia bacterium]|nr:MAG: hypothetical protein EA394_00225 [Bacteroidia bacterium]